MKNKVKAEIFKEISEETGSSIEEISEIVESALQYTAYQIEHSGFETIMLPYWGKFWVNPKRLHLLNQNKLKPKTHEAI